MNDPVNESPFLAIKRLETQIIGILRGFDLFGMEGDHRKVVKELKRELADARLDIRDYELSETRAEQLDNAKEAKVRLAKIRAQLLTASEYAIFTPVDIALFSANLEQIIKNVR